MTDHDRTCDCIHCARLAVRKVRAQNALNAELEAAVEELVAAVEATAHEVDEVPWLTLTPNEVAQLAKILSEEPKPQVRDGLRRLFEHGTAWTVDPHVTTPDVEAVEAAADDLKHRLDHTGE